MSRVSLDGEDTPEEIEEFLTQEHTIQTFLESFGGYNVDERSLQERLLIRERRRLLDNMNAFLTAHVRRLRQTSNGVSE